MKPAFAEELAAFAENPFEWRVPGLIVDDSQVMFTKTCMLHNISTNSSDCAPSFPDLRGYLFLSTDCHLRLLAFEDILYVEETKGHVKIHVRNGFPVVSQVSIKTMMKALPEDRFFLVGNSHIVQLSRIEAIERKHIIIGKTKIPVSEDIMEDLMDSLNNSFLAVL